MAADTLRTVCRKYKVDGGLSVWGFRDYKDNCGSILPNDLK